MTESETHGSGTYPEGTTIVDCGEEGEIAEVFEVGDETTYDIEFESGDELSITEQEMELGIADGTIEVNHEL